MPKLSTPDSYMSPNRAWTKGISMSDGVADPLVRPRIVAWLRYEKNRLGLSQQELAQYLGTTAATVSNLLNDKVSPGLDMLVRMHRRLHISVDRMLDVDPPAVDHRPVRPPLRREK